jgi:hypothetical protein
LALEIISHKVAAMPLFYTYELYNMCAIKHLHTLPRITAVLWEGFNFHFLTEFSYKNNHIHLICTPITQRKNKLIENLIILHSKKSGIFYNPKLRVLAYSLVKR